MSTQPAQPAPVMSPLTDLGGDSFRRMVESIEECAIFMLDPIGHVVSWNKGAERVKGYTSEEVLGQPLSLFYPREDVTAGKPGQGLERARAEGCCREDGERLRKGGTPFWASTTTTPLFDHDGNHVGFARVTRDITEERRTEIALAESEERNRRLLEHVTAKGRRAWVRSIGEAVCDAEGRSAGSRGAFQDLPDRKGIQEGQRRLAEQLTSTLENIQELAQGILITDPRKPDNPIIYASAGVERITGYRPEEVLGRNGRFLQGHGTDPETVRELREAIAAGRACAVEILNYRKGGAPFWSALSVHPVRDEKGAPTYFVGVQSDITERRELEAQLLQSQKMEAVGRLAGGVAHDFNNLLTVISGYSEILLDMPDLTEEARDSVNEVREAGKRAASLTRQLLGFSRQALLQPRVLGLNSLVAETAAMLRRLIGEDILFTTVLDPTLRPAKVDPGQLNQVIMNLAVNARDAMPKGGKLTVETANVFVGEDYAATHLDCRPGPHVMLAMSDTGLGMTPEVLARIFEPFFTTKEVGKGTGLGLAMVLGIVQQSGGCVHVYSEPGRGSTFKIYLPAVDEPLSGAADPVSRPGARGTETVLLVEDDEGVRRLAQGALKTHGYEVLVATDGKDALRVAQAHGGTLDLLLTDVVMPGVGGPELAGAMKARFPGIKVLFMSGYTDDTVVRHGLLEAEVSFLQKPYTPLDLARRVREVLDGPAAGESGARAAS